MRPQEAVEGTVCADDLPQLGKVVPEAEGYQEDGYQGQEKPRSHRGRCAAGTARGDGACKDNMAMPGAGSCRRGILRAKKC